MNVLLLAGLLLLGDPIAEGIRAFRAGRAREAQAAFERALQEQGDGAAAGLRYNLALAALHAGDFEAAQRGASEALERDAGAFGARAAFLIGCAAAGRAEEAARLAAQPGAIPADWDLALARARLALDSFAQALDAGAADWPEARRNAARVMLRIAEWERARAAAEPPRSDSAPRPAAEPPRVEELLSRLEAMERPPASAAAAPPAGAGRDW